jgi:hypothetical protein
MRDDSPDTRSAADWYAHIKASPVKEVPPEGRGEGWMQRGYTGDGGVTTEMGETTRARGWDNPIRRHVLHGHVASSTFIAPSAPRHTLRRHTPTSRAPRRRTHRGRARARAPDPDLDSDPPGHRRDRSPGVDVRLGVAHA